MSVFRVGSNKSSVNNFPSVRPTLDLDFANSKTLDPRITFTRASGGSYVGADGLIKYAGVNEARFDHDQNTGESLGLLIEESRTNLITYSEDFTNAVWAAGADITRLSTSTTSPSGTSNGNKLTNNSNSNNFNYTYQAYTSSTKGAYTFSLFVKDNDISTISIIVGTDSFEPNYARATYTFSTQSFSSYQYVGTPKGYVSSSTSTSYSNGWYKLSITFDTTSFASQTSLSVGIYPGVYGSTAASYTKSFYVWGAQLEQASFPTSYIPTVASTRTRAADNASITGKNFSEWYRQDEGALCATYSRNVDKNNQMVAQIRNADGSNRIEIRGQGGASNNFRIEVIEGGRSSQQEFTITPSGNTISTFHKCNLAYKQNNFASAINGTLYTDNTGVVGNCDRIDIGAANYGAGDFNGHIAQITYYPKRLPNAQLQALTK